MSKKLSTLVGALVGFAVVAAISFNRQWIKDQYIVKTTSLAPQSQNLANDLMLTPRANFLFKASQPLVEDSQAFNAACRSVAKEQSIVLGCYTQQRIYIYNVTDQRLNGVQQVTAAHELLHAAYQRMPTNERNEVNKLLESTADTISDARFKDTLAEYRRTEPDQIDNELHSIIGTEIAVLPEALEVHYQKYFTNRSKIVDYAKQYETTFTDLDNQIKSYDTELNALRGEKESLEKTLAAEQSSIEAENTRLNSLRRSGDTAAYNDAVPGYNQSVKTYNANIARLKEIIAQYNDIVDKRNQLATTQNNLTKQLDSTYQPLQ